MPRGPKGEKRPADVIGAAVMVAKIATGEIEETPRRSPRQVKAGRIGGPARAAALSDECRREIAKKGANSRWNKRKSD
jgi:hypothetical protein